MRITSDSNDEQVAEAFEVQLKLRYKRTRKMNKASICVGVLSLETCHHP